MQDSNLKALRALVAHGENRFCFDCNQRGPTYVNMTIGSYVCTTCSGALRKYNHRVKAISMSNFTHEEIEFLCTRGNKACKQIFLSQNTNGVSETETRSGGLDNYLRSKYHLKKWYSQPTAQLELEALRENHSIIENMNQSTTDKSRFLVNSNSAAGLIVLPTNIPIDGFSLRSQKHNYVTNGLSVKRPSIQSSSINSHFDTSKPTTITENLFEVNAFQSTIPNQSAKLSLFSSTNHNLFPLSNTVLSSSSSSSPFSDPFASNMNSFGHLSDCPKTSLSENLNLFPTAPTRDPFSSNHANTAAFPSNGQDLFQGAFQSKPPPTSATNNHQPFTPNFGASPLIANATPSMTQHDVHKMNSLFGDGAVDATDPFFITNVQPVEPRSSNPFKTDLQPAAVKTQSPNSTLPDLFGLAQTNLFQSNAFDVHCSNVDPFSTVSTVTSTSNGSDLQSLNLNFEMPASDKYAALAELDGMYKCQSATQDTSPAVGGHNSAFTLAASNHSSQLSAPSQTYIPPTMATIAPNPFAEIPLVPVSQMPVAVPKPIDFTNPFADTVVSSFYMNTPPSSHAFPITGQFSAAQQPNSSVWSTQPKESIISADSNQLFPDFPMPTAATPAFVPNDALMNGFGDPFADTSITTVNTTPSFSDPFALPSQSSLFDNNPF